MSDPIKGNFPTFTEFCHRPDPTYPKGKNQKFQCPVCNHFTLDEIAAYNICEVCFWEDDGTTNEHSFSPNGISLSKGRENYLKHGVSTAVENDSISE
jgi:Cysteine-rich CPCC